MCRFKPGRKEISQSQWRRFLTRQPSWHLVQVRQESLGAFAKLRKATTALNMASRLSVRLSAQNTSAQRWTYFHEIWHLIIFRESVEEILTRITGTLLEDLYIYIYIYIYIYSWVLLRMRTVSNFVEKITTYISRSVTSLNRSLDEKKWKNTVQPDRPQVTIRRMRTACWIPKATNAHSEYVIHVAFPL
jgi:hypothetical protein